MKTIFMPGCGVKRDYQDELKMTMDYLKEHFEDVELYEACCKMDVEKPKADTFIYSCFGCYPRMEAINTAKNYYSIYEIFDKYGLPAEAKQENKNVVVGIHECSKLKDDQKNKDLLRKIVKQLGYQIEEAQVITEEHDKCAKVLVASNGEQGIEVLQSQLANYKADTIVTMCKGCKANFDKTSKNGTHLFELIFK